MKKFSYIHTYIVGLVVLLPASLASATSAPAGFYTATLNLQDNGGVGYFPINNETFYSTPPSMSLSNGTYPQSGSFAFNSQGSNPSVFMSATTGEEGTACSPCQTAIAEGAIYYFFYIIAPNGTTPATSVPVILNGQSTLSSGPGFGSAAVSAALSGIVGYQAVCSIVSQETGSCGIHSYQLSGSFNPVTANSGDYSGQISISSTAVSGSGAGTASAYIDPYIAIDPSFLAANPGYTITVSDGFSNIAPVSSTVPEPTTFSLGGAALLALFGLRRIVCTNRSN